MNRIAVVSFAAVVLAGSAFAQFGGGPQGLGAGAGLYVPTDSLIKNIFGDQITTYNFGLVQPNRRGRKNFGYDINLQGVGARGSRFLSLEGTYGYEWHFAEEDAKALPYFRIGAGPNLLDYDITSPLVGGNLRRTTIGGVAAAEAGLVLNGFTSLSAQYVLMSKSQGLDFSGLRLQLSIKLISF